MKKIVFLFVVVVAISFFSCSNSKKNEREIEKQNVYVVIGDSIVSTNSYIDPNIIIGIQEGEIDSSDIEFRIAELTLDLTLNKYGLDSDTVAVYIDGGNIYLLIPSQQ